MTNLSAPINIFSGEPGLGAALTNPTELGRSKGSIAKAYRVTYAGKLYGDAESAYQVNKTGDAEQDDRMMAEVICAKFRQHPGLAAEVEACGGAAWLASCTHFTYAKTEGAQAWEGAGLESRFIRNLVAGWHRFKEGNHEEQGQSSLF
jgi:hypothetical protein